MDAHKNKRLRAKSTEVTCIRICAIYAMNMTLSS